MNIIYKAITVVSLSEEAALVTLLDECFPEIFDGRSFFKQEPHYRILAYSKGKLIGHIGFDRRVINVGGRILKILGVIDLCVAQEIRKKGIGSALLRHAEKQALDRDFIVLMADNDKLYQRAGFHRLPQAPTRWLAIEGLESHSIIERDLSDCFMYKPLASGRWPDGKIDLLGYLF